MKMRYLFAAAMLALPSTGLAGMSESMSSDKNDGHMEMAWVGEPPRAGSSLDSPGSPTRIELTTAPIAAPPAKRVDFSFRPGWLDGSPRMMGVASNLRAPQTEVEQAAVSIPLPAAAPAALATLGLIVLGGYLRRLRKIAA